MYLIGIVGKKRVGKDTCYAIIKDLLHGRHVERLAFADALKEEISKATGYPVNFINQNKQHFRLLLQAWGTEFRRGLHGQDYWVKQWLDRVVKLPEHTYAVVVTDVRFRNEADTIRNASGYLWHLKRKTGFEDGHQSETELGDNINYNEVIYNDGTLDELKGNINRVLRLHGLRPA